MAFEFRRFGALIIVAALPALLTACNATSHEAAAPAATGEGADRSAVYPDITAPVTAATAQMSNEEAAAMSARLEALARNRQSGAISEAEYRRQLAEMQALGEGHGQAALSQIAGQN